MKKIIMFLLCLSFLVQPIQANDDLGLQAPSAYLMEYSTGKVLYEKNALEKMFPASMTKMMGLILIYEALDSGMLQLDEMVSVSENAASMGGSQIYLEPNEMMSVSDLLKAICIASANDAMVAMAEKIGGTVTNFVNQMNEKAKELNLENTHFTNTTGLHDDEHYSCAKDMAMIGQELIRVGQEELLAITSTYDAYVRENTASPFWLVNTNKLVKQLEGVDGLKSGFTQEAKSCITVTAKRGDIRLISVVMNEADSKIRNAESKQLIDYGFSLVSYVPIYEVHDIYENVEIKLASPKNVDLVFLEPVGSIQVKDQVVSIKEMQLKITASLPYEVHEKIGEVTIHFDDGTVIAADVGVNERVLPLTYFDLVLSSMASLLTN